MGGYGYYGDMEIVAGPEMPDASIVGIVFVIYGLIMLFTLAFSVAVYILHSLGLYTIAQRRGIRKPWLAWLPVGNFWILGNISDQYQYLVQGKVKSRRKVLVGLSIAMIAVYFLWVFGLVVNAIVGQPGSAAVVGFVLLVVGGMLGLLVTAITLMVFQYMCYYDLYRSCEPSNSVLYLILSILFSGIMPFLVFVCRKKDGGMPPRKQPAPQYGQPAPQYGQPAPQYGQPAPQYGQPAPQCGQPTPQYGQQTPQAAPEEETHKEGVPEDEQTIPVADA